MPCIGGGRGVEREVLLASRHPEASGKRAAAQSHATSAGASATRSGRPWRVLCVVRRSAHASARLVARGGVRSSLRWVDAGSCRAYATLLSERRCALGSPSSPYTRVATDAVPIRTPAEQKGAWRCRSSTIPAASLLPCLRGVVRRRSTATRGSMQATCVQSLPNSAIGAREGGQPPEGTHVGERASCKFQARRLMFAQVGANRADSATISAEPGRLGPKSG